MVWIILCLLWSSNFHGRQVSGETFQSLKGIIAHDETHPFIHGGDTPCQFEHHVRRKFATPILHVINNFKNYEIFSTYT
jgi:hypothetical protein